MPHRSRARQGMTLVELLVALTIFAVVISTSVAFMARQNSVFQESVRRLVALRNLRYAITSLGQDLETLGTNVPDGQPALYFGDGDVVSFSADYATNVGDDPFAVFHDPHAPAGQVRAPVGGFQIPNAPVAFPDTAYEAAPGVASPAEVLTFFFAPDTATTRADDFVLFRQVNAASPEPVARNLLRDGTEPFFGYLALADDGTGAKVLQAVPDSLVPLHHVAWVHLSPTDTGRSALTDSVRAVRIRLRATNGLSGDEEVTVAMDRLVPLPNAGLGLLATCGSPPLLGVGLSATAVSLGTGEPAVDLSWGPAVDEAGGEGDVVRYVIWRQQVGDPGWGDPFRAIPAGAPSYSYQDATVTSGTAYRYALAAQDCTPTLSSLAASNVVVIP